jgi:hypothetical protein
MTNPEHVVQRQLDAYNARDADAWASTYAETAQLFLFPDTLVASGRDAIRERIRPRFTEPNLHALLLKRTVMGALVVDHERVTRTFDDGPGTVEIVAIYEVGAGSIARAWFMFGEEQRVVVPRD